VLIYLWFVACKRDGNGYGGETSQYWRITSKFVRTMKS